LRTAKRILVYLVFSEYLFLEFLLIIIVKYFIVSSNILILLYTAGLYLLVVGLYALLGDADIYIGFLWVIDLGVGLVFFIFMLHFTPFLHQKSKFNFKVRNFILHNIFLLNIVLYFYFFSLNIDNKFNLDLSKMWFFNVLTINYYFIFFVNEITELNLLRETYFLVCSFIFFIINFSLFYGFVTAILLCFLIHRVFNFLNFSQMKYIKAVLFLNSSFFIRLQDPLLQSNTAAITKS
jgi:hypothetical protein